MIAKSKTVIPKPAEKQPDFRDGKGYKRITSRGLSLVIGSICLLFGLFACLDNWGPPTVSHETVMGLPCGGNLFLIRTDKTYFPIAAELEYEAPSLRGQAIDVDKSMLSGTSLSFSLPVLAPGEKFSPVDTIYSYIGLNVLCFLAGLLLIVYPKKSDLCMYFVFFAVLSIIASAIPMIGLKMTIDSIYAVKTTGW